MKQPQTLHPRKQMKTPNNMKSTHRNRLFPSIQSTAPALALAFLTIAWPIQAGPGHHASHRLPDLPSPVCDILHAPAGTRLSSHVYALGVQIYQWNGSSWGFVGPDAALFADPGFHGQVGIHYGGPTWEANDGSQVVAARQSDCTPFPGAIPWLLLGATSTSGHGVFARVTHIQRVNTIGGTAPAQAGAFVGEEVRVPYTAEYFFYCAQ
jgi:hypothetical protein